MDFLEDSQLDREVYSLKTALDTYQTVEGNNLSCGTLIVYKGFFGMLPGLVPQRPVMKNGLAGRVQSFRYAFRGIRVMLESQKNAWIHATISLIVFGAGVFFNLSWAEWCWVVLAIVAVWTAEALNTAFEFLADVASPEFHPLVEKSKDVAAASVLISAVGSVIIGLLVLGPYIVALFNR